MRRKPEAQSAAVLPGLHFLERLPQPDILPVVIISGQPPADDGTHSALTGSPCCLMDMHLHIIERRRPGPDHLNLGKQGSPVRILRFQPAFNRIDSAKQPVHEGKVVRAVAHDRHIGMRMRVDQSWNYQPVLPIYHLILCKTIRPVINPRDQITADVEGVLPDPEGGLSFLRAG